MTKLSLRAVLLITLFIALLTLDISVMLLYKRVELNAVDSSHNYFLTVLHQPLLWLGITLSGLQLLVWRNILARADLSIAYPISSLSYPLTMIAAILVYHEHLPINVWIGALLITSGVAVIGHRARHGA